MMIKIPAYMEKLPKDCIKVKENMMTIDTNKLEEGVPYLFRFMGKKVIIVKNHDDSSSFSFLGFWASVKLRKVIKKVENSDEE